MLDELDVDVVSAAGVDGSSELPHAAPRKAINAMPVASVPRRVLRFMGGLPVGGLCCERG
jgi:hypothetical protein